MRGDILFLLTALCVSRGNAQQHYTPSGSCETEHTCEYLYSVEQSRFTRNVNDSLIVTANVQIACESSGTYGSLAATRYCMTVEELDGNFLSLVEDDSYDDSTVKKYLVEQYLAGWFCFMQTSEGEVVSVYHSREEKIEAVNFKKGIAAAFQANFMGTEEKTEIDPQSKHTSHYSYQQSEDGSTKMHRTVLTGDVVEYPLHVSPQDIQLVKEEDVEYRRGRLSKSNGTTHVSLSEKFSDNTATSSSDPDIDMFSYDGSFSMELQVCRLVPQATRRKRAIIQQYLSSDLNLEENLMSVYDETTRDLEMLASIRNKLNNWDSILQILQNLNESNNNFGLLEKAMHLEFKYGPPEGYVPVVDYVLNYLKELSELDSEEAIFQRATIYSLLGFEGSRRSQEALIRSFQSLLSARERNALIVAIATVSNPTDQLIKQLETQINLRADPTDPLLLAYGALIANAAPDMQRQMVSFLTERLPEAEADEAALVHLIHSLGNTRSELVVEHVVRFVDHDEEMIKITSITALRFFRGTPYIQDTLLHVLLDNASEAVVSAIIDALSEGFEQDRDMQVQEDIIIALLNLTLTFDNHDLEVELGDFFRIMGTEVSLRLARTLEAHKSSTRYQRDTSIWSSSNSDYNAIASQSSRASDVATYPHYLSYLWSKKLGRTEGNYQVYVQAAAGLFGGLNSDSNFKLFGKVVLRGHVFGQEHDAIILQTQIRKRGRDVHKVLYARIGFTTYVDVNEWEENVLPEFSVSSFSSSFSVSVRRSLPSIRKQIFSYSFPVWIYAGRVNLGVSFHMSLGGTLTLSLRPQGIGASALLSYVPEASASVVGSVSYTFLEVARVGASLSGTVPYDIGAEGTAKFCLNPGSGSFEKEVCTDIYHEWPGNYIRLYAWFQSREIQYCSFWGSSYPCGFGWGDQQTWDSLTYTYYISSSSGRTILYNRCYGRATC